jgi:hypothetical protein
MLSELCRASLPSRQDDIVAGFFNITQTPRRILVVYDEDTSHWFHRPRPRTARATATTEPTLR